MKCPYILIAHKIRLIIKRVIKLFQLRRTGHHKTRFTLILCASNDGRKLPPAIIFKDLKNVPKPRGKEKDCPENIFPKGIHIMASMGGTMNKEHMEEWVKVVIKGQKDTFQFDLTTKGKTRQIHKKLLVMDSAKAHMNTEIREYLSRECGTKVEIMEGGMTPLLQPADVSWNRSVKNKIKDLWGKMDV